MTPRSAGTPRDGAAPRGSTLTQAQFHILVTLAEGQRHGYGIMQAVEEQTDGAVVLGPGTLYRSLRQLMDRGLIQEADGPTPESTEDGPPRRPYALTERGRSLAAEETRRLRTLVRWAGQALGLEGSQP